MEKLIINIDDRDYHVFVKKMVSKSLHEPRLVIVSYQPNYLSTRILQVCINSIKKYSDEPYELWIVDNNSPMQQIKWMNDLLDCNIIFNRNEPIPKTGRTIFSYSKYILKNRSPQEFWGSYANACALEIARRIIDQQSKYMMTLHMDIMPCHPQWLSFLKSKLTNNIVAAGFRLDRVRISNGSLHILGLLLDFQLFQKLNISFLPQLPAYDVGDLITVTFQKAGYDVFGCHNTLWEPDLNQQISTDSPLHGFNVDRSFDDDGNVIFLHFGRGISRSSRHKPGKITIEEWIEFAKRFN